MHFLLITRRLWLTLGIIFGIMYILNKAIFIYDKKWYLNTYLKSDNWKRKRAIVLKRDNFKCQICGAPATQVHHKKYYKNALGKEHIEHLISVCNKCHKTCHLEH